MFTVNTNTVILTVSQYSAKKQYSLLLTLTLSQYNENAVRYNFIGNGTALKECVMVPNQHLLTNSHRVKDAERDHFSFAGR